MRGCREGGRKARRLRKPIKLPLVYTSQPFQFVTSFKSDVDEHCLKQHRFVPDMQSPPAGQKFNTLHLLLLRHAA